MKKGKKKEIVKRNVVNQMMCEDHRFRTKVFKNKKKELKKFDIRKEYCDRGANENCSSFLLSCPFLFVCNEERLVVHTITPKNKATQ